MTWQADPAWEPVAWPAPTGVKAAMTTRLGGVSRAPFDSFNLGDHVGDDPICVAANRQRLTRLLGVQTVFLKQIHGIHVEHLQHHTPHGTVADACVTQSLGLACTVMVADCLPVLLTDSVGRTVAAAHAGWRGLAGVDQPDGQGVLASTLKTFGQLVPTEKTQGASCSDSCPATPVGLAGCMAWLGPCIGPAAFEVGAEVREAFMACGLPVQAVSACFEPVAGATGKYHAHLASLARLQLSQLGLTNIYGNDGSDAWCTVTQSSRWFSHRRDAGSLGSTGRMAACVWLEG